MIQDHGTPFSVTAAGTSTTSALYAGTTSQLIFVTDISASSTGTMGTWAVLVGTTPLWQGAGTVNYKFSEPLRVASGNSVSIFANGTTATYAGVAGFYVKVS